MRQETLLIIQLLKLLNGLFCSISSGYKCKFVLQLTSKATSSGISRIVYQLAVHDSGNLIYISEFDNFGDFLHDSQVLACLSPQLLQLYRNLLKQILNA